MKKQLIALLFFVFILPVCTAIECGNMWDWLNRACEFSDKINKEGKQDLYVTGWAWHNPQHYSKEKRNQYRSFTYGGGVGKTMLDESNNAHSLYGLAFADSHSRPQLMIGYAYQAYWPIVNELKFGVGYSFGLTSRRDVWQGVPFPHLIPLLSIKYHSTTLLVSYVPYFRGKGSGDVAFVLGKYTFQ